MRRLQAARLLPRPEPFGDGKSFGEDGKENALVSA